MNRTTDTVRVLLVEDHASLREALQAVVALEDDVEVVGAVARGDEAVEAARRLAPDVAVVDLDLPGSSGVEVIRLLRVASPDTRCLVLTALRDEVELGRAVEAGAAGLLHKSTGIDQILDAVRDVAAGATLLPPDTTARVLSALSRSRDDGWRAEVAREVLSPREVEVLGLLGRGATNHAMADELGISPDTAQTHVRNLLGKLGVHSRLEAVVTGLRLGLLEPPAPGDELPGSG